MQKKHYGTTFSSASYREIESAFENFSEHHSGREKSDYPITTDREAISCLMNVLQIEGILKVKYNSARITDCIMRAMEFIK